MFERYLSTSLIGTPSTVACRYECSAMLSSTELEITCNVDGSHVTISHIDFTVNDDSEERGIIECSQRGKN